ncbi:translation initiation factor IF-2-like [Harpia harpyja]|uniref:translation initiation factor IF-2-like n=1 Tax=Harpia harpyja TaxID=202280 RepID=UPI0022B19416|nr:translation initiation factor IF-2-like [Harpia harpyja]
MTKAEGQHSTNLRPIVREINSSELKDALWMTTAAFWSELHSFLPCLGASDENQTRAFHSLYLTKSVGQYLRQDGYQLISLSFRKSKVLRVCLTSRAVPWSPGELLLSGTAYRTRGEEHAARWLGRPAPLRRSRGAGTPPSSPTAAAWGAPAARLAPHRARREPRLPLAAVVSRWAGCGAALPGGAGSCSRGTAGPPLSRPARRIALLSPRSSAAAGKESRGVPGTPLQERGAGEGAKGPSVPRPGVPPRETGRPPLPACGAPLAKAGRGVCQHLPGAARGKPGGVPGEHRKLSRP